jgi:hypothetical protein
MISIPSDLRPLEARQSILLAIEELKTRFPQGLPKLNPVKVTTSCIQILWCAYYCCHCNCCWRFFHIHFLALPPLPGAAPEKKSKKLKIKKRFLLVHRGMGIEDVYVSLHYHSSYVHNLSLGSMIAYQWVFGRIYYALNREVNCAFLFCSMMPIYQVHCHFIIFYVCQNFLFCFVPF